MLKETLIALRATVVTLVLCGLVYPLLVTGLAQLIMPRLASGSLVKDAHGREVGSELIGQRFTRPSYFQGRPSAAGYDASASSGSNLGPTSAKLRQRASSDVARLRKENPAAPGPVPADLVTTSGSGLDPDIGVQAALWQVPRVAAARGVAPGRMRSLVEQQIQGRDVGLLGEPHVNVLLLNLALDQQFPEAGISR